MQAMDSLLGFLSMVGRAGIGSTERCFSTDRAVDGRLEVAQEALGVGGKSERSERCAKHGFEVLRFGFFIYFRMLKLIFQIPSF